MEKFELEPNITAATDDNASIDTLDTMEPPKRALAHEAQVAANHERQMGLLDAMRLYPKAAAWSIIFSTAVVMEGFDTIMMNTFFAYPPFKRRYGSIGPDGEYFIPASWQSALANGARAGEIIGLYFNGPLSERYGHRRTMMVALVLVVVFIFIPFFAPNIQTLVAGQVLLGVPWGIFQTITTAYAAEVCPVPMRNYLTTYVNLCWVIGQLLSTGVLRALLNRPDEWAYRIPFGLQWMWPIPIAIAVFLAPESPWWLVRKGKIEEAEASLQRLTSEHDPLFNSHNTVSMMMMTIDHEIEVSTGTSYMDCFRGVDLRRTEIACLIWAAQSLCGSAIMSWSTNFFEEAGLNSEDAFDMTLAQFGVGFIGTLLSWVVMRFLGRRPIFVGGLFLLFILMLVIGFTGIAPVRPATEWATGALLVGFTFVYDCSVGPVVYSLVAELPSVRLRSKTIALARILFNIASIVNAIITPYMLTQWDWKAKSGFFWGGICFLFAVWSYFRVPEPKGRTYGELDILFERRISARKFKGTVVTAETEDGIVP